MRPRALLLAQSSLVLLIGCGSGAVIDGGTSPSDGGTPMTDGGVDASSAIETPGLIDRSLLEDYDGPYEISSGTVVLENVRLTGRLTIRGGTVTIRNCTASFDDYYHVLVDGGSLVLEHCELDGMNTVDNADDLGVSGANITVRYSIFRRFVNAMRPASNSTLEHNLVEMPNTAFADAHTDGIEVYGGEHIVVRGNTIDIHGGAGETGCVNIATDFGDIDDVLVEDNDFTGGTYSLYGRVQGAGSALTNVRVIGNRWHTPRVYGTHSIDPRSAITEWADNTDDGAPLSF